MKLSIIFGSKIYLTKGIQLTNAVFGSTYNKEWRRWEDETFPFQKILSFNFLTEPIPPPLLPPPALPPLQLHNSICTFTGFPLILDNLVSWRILLSLIVSHCSTRPRYIKHPKVEINLDLKSRIQVDVLFAFLCMKIWGGFLTPYSFIFTLRASEKIFEKEVNFSSLIFRLLQ